jgi:hypothetical protein
MKPICVTTSYIPKIEGLEKNFIKLKIWHTLFAMSLVVIILIYLSYVNYLSYVKLKIMKL